MKGWQKWLGICVGSTTLILFAVIIDTSMTNHQLCRSTRIQALDRQISQHRCMLKSYEKELEYLKSLGCQQASPRLVTAHENMRQLTAALAQLEQNLAIMQVH